MSFWQVESWSKQLANHVPKLAKFPPNLDHLCINDRDGWPGYNGIEAKGYTHEVTVMSQHDEPAHQLMPRVHRVASLLKRWLLGTHQGAVREKHVDYYLDEYTFRFNRRRSRARGLLFYRLLQNAVAVDPVPYGQLVGGQSERDHKIW